ncbi:MAG: hypothetical protein ACRDAI_08225 [Candidatus Rhabdochlamydia sp.]
MLNTKESLKEKISHLLTTRKNTPSFNKTIPSPQSKMKSFIWVIFAALCVIGVGMVFKKELKRQVRKQGFDKHFMEKLEKGVLGTTYCLGKTPVPFRLASVPYGEDSGLVLGVKQVNIRNVNYPYNASLILSPSGYELFFRYDVTSIRSKYFPFYSRIGVVHLNDQFEQEEKEFKRIHLQTDYAEDPRVLLVEDKLYMFYNVLNTKNLQNRSMYVANLDRTSFDVNYSTMLDMNLQWVEKNWSPFEYVGADQKGRLFIEYQISPRKLLELPDPKVNEIKNLTLPQEVAYLPLFWTKKWGIVRGGTPAQKIGNEYLGFFHSSFADKDKGLVWYVMGAYTFAAEPPFGITGISNYPILFRSIFETPTVNKDLINKRVIFPSGFVIEKKDGKELIQLACGENDSSIKVITLDKEKLMKSMNRFED